MQRTSRGANDRLLGRLGLAALAAVAVLAGCAGKQTVVVQAEEEIRRIDMFLYNVEKAYADQDFASFEGLFSAEYRQANPALFDEVRRILDGARKIRMDLSVDLIQIDGQTVRILLHWIGQAEWADERSRQQGNATFLLRQRGEDLQIAGIEGDNPFLFSSPPATQG